jgi:hypothetical protein
MDVAYDFDLVFQDRIQDQVISDDETPHVCGDVGTRPSEIRMDGESLGSSLKLLYEPISGAYVLIRDVTPNLNQIPFGLFSPANSHACFFPVQAFCGPPP